MYQPPRTGSGRAMALQQRDDDDDDSDLASELDLDLYDTDEVPDGHNPHGMSLSGIPSILNRDSVLSPSPQVRRGLQPAIKTNRLSDASVPTTNQDTVSLAGSSTRQAPPRRPANPNHSIRTDFTTTRDATGGGGQMPLLDDNYEILATPPGEPPQARPEEGVHPAFALPPRTEMSMRAEWLIGLIGVGLGVGIAIASQHSNEELSYWLTTIGDLYVRMTACITLPLAFCQVVTATAELVNNNKLQRAWLYTALYFFITVVLSSAMSVFCGSVFHSTFKSHAPRANRISHAKFAFKCSDGTYIEQHESGPVTCSGQSVNTNTTFLRMIDISQRLGIDDAVGNVNISQYFFAMLEIFFPSNVVGALAADNFLSALLVALVLGVAISKSYTCPPGAIKRSKNPLFRLFTHVYLSLFAMNDWTQKLALWAIVPLMMGAVLEMPDATNTLQLTRFYLVAAVLSCLSQCLFVVPLLFFIVTRQNPFRWIIHTLAPTSYGMVLSSAFYPLPMATKAALRSKEVSPSVFGAVYPILSVLNRTQFSIILPCGLLYVAAFSGCSIELNVTNVMLMFAITCLSSFGDTMLPFQKMANFLMMWRVFCENEDTPTSVVMIATVGILIYRFTALVGVMTNMMLIRMISFAVERDNRKLQNQLDSIVSEHPPAPASPASFDSSLTTPVVTGRVM